MTTKMRKLAALGLVATLSLFGAGCGNDEDGDGATTDEEVNQVDETGEDVGNEVEQEVDEGAEEVEE